MSFKKNLDKILKYIILEIDNKNATQEFEQDLLR